MVKWKCVTLYEVFEFRHDIYAASHLPRDNTIQHVHKGRTKCWNISMLCLFLKGAYASIKWTIKSPFKIKKRKEEQLFVKHSVRQKGFKYCISINLVIYSHTIFSITVDVTSLCWHGLFLVCWLYGKKVRTFTLNIIFIFGWKSSLHWY